jgi:hypothetical protein
LVISGYRIASVFEACGFRRHSSDHQTQHWVYRYGKVRPRIFRRLSVKARILYRISSVLMLLFAAGHGFGFRQNVPEWHADAVIGLMRSVHFDAQGFRRTYWDFFSAFGLYLSVFLLFAAALAWLLAGFPPETLARVRSIAWALAICFVAVTALTWRYAFTTPLVLSILITVCLVAAAWFSPKTA